MSWGSPATPSRPSWANQNYQNRYGNKMIEIQVEMDEIYHEMKFEFSLTMSHSL